MLRSRIFSLSIWQKYSSLRAKSKRRRWEGTEETRQVGEGRREWNRGDGDRDGFDEASNTEQWSQ